MIWKEKSLPSLIYIVFGAHRKIKAIQCFQKANAAGALHTGTTAPRSRPHCSASEHSNLKPSWSNLARYQAAQLQRGYKQKICQAGSFTHGSLLKTKTLFVNYRYLTCVCTPFPIVLHYISSFALTAVGRLEYHSQRCIRNTQARITFWSLHFTIWFQKINCTLKCASQLLDCLVPNGKVLTPQVLDVNHGICEQKMMS